MGSVIPAPFSLVTSCILCHLAQILTQFDKELQENCYSQNVQLF